MVTCYENNAKMSFSICTKPKISKVKLTASAGEAQIEL
jgi:hypothetical protein